MTRRCAAVVVFYDHPRIRKILPGSRRKFLFLLARVTTLPQAIAGIGPKPERAHRVQDVLRCVRSKAVDYAAGVTGPSANVQLSLHTDNPTARARTRARGESIERFNGRVRREVLAIDRQLTPSFNARAHRIVGDAKDGLHLDR